MFVPNIRILRALAVDRIVDTYRMHETALAPACWR